MKRFLLVVLVLLFYFGCKTDVAESNLREALRQYEPKTQIFKANSDSLIELRGDKGTVLQIDPSVLQHQDGRAVKGALQIHLLELTSTEDLLRANAQTVSNGKWLISGGAYNIQIFSENKELKIADGKSIEVSFPKITTEEMQLFDGNRDMKGNMNWELSNRVLKNRKYPVVIRRDSSFMRFNRQFAIDMPVDTLIYSISKEKLTFEEIEKAHPQLDSIVVKNDTILGIRFERGVAETTPTDSVVNYDDLYDASTGNFLNTNPTMELMNDIYQTISINKLGWINVDRFYPEITNRVRFQITSDIDMDYAQIYAADSENNTLLDLYQDENGIIFFNAPLEKRFTIIAFGIKGEQVYGYKKNVLIEKDTEHQIKYRKADKKKMETYFKLD